MYKNNDYFIIFSKQDEAQKEQCIQFNSWRQCYIKIIKYTSKFINHRIKFNFCSQISPLTQYITKYTIYTL